MATAKVAVTIDQTLLRELDRWVADGAFVNRSRAIQAAIELLRESRSGSSVLLRELSKLDPTEEKAMAEEWLDSELQWPPS
jgi:Arc/MetJ-type ribon-helix-helix transcriptional regulator